MTTPHRRLEGKVAVITGAGAGIGRAMAHLFARHGAQVAAVDVDTRGLEALGRERDPAGGAISRHRADVTRRDECERVIAQVIREHDRLDILCNNAGIVRRANVLELEEEEWDLHMAVNVKSVYLWSRTVLPQMIRQGSGVILNTGSGWGLIGGRRAASYCASKGAVVQLTRALALDHGRQGIRVNCLCPGDTETAMLRHEAEQLGLTVETFRREAAERPLGRVGTPEEMAHAALYLVSEEASFITGTTLVVDGGGLAGG